MKLTKVGIATSALVMALAVGNMGPAYAASKARDVTGAQMAKAMWKVFNATTWDVVKHPTMAQVGVHPSQTVDATVYDVSNWLAQWAGGAKGYKAEWGPENGKFVPFSLKYEVSSDPYTWAKVDDLFEGTHIRSKYSKITPRDEAQILSNLKWWLQGVKVVNGTYHLHAPMYGGYASWVLEFANPKVKKHPSELLHNHALAEVISYLDRVTFSVKGSTIELALPNTTHSKYHITYSANDGYYFWGHYGPGAFAQFPAARGGSTLQVPNKGKMFQVALYSDYAGFGVGVELKSGSTLAREEWDINNGQ